MQTVDTEITRTLVLRIYEAYTQGDGETLAALLHDDIDWLIHGPMDVLPFAGPRKGKAQVLQALALLRQQFVLKRHVPEVLLAEGDKAAVLSNVAFVQRVTGRVVTFRLADFLRLADGRLIEFRELLDSFDATQQTLGRWLRV